MKTAQSGQHNIQNQDIIAVAAGQMQAFLAVKSGVNRKALFTESLFDKTGSAMIVFYYQNSHIKALRSMFFFSADCFQPSAEPV